MSQNELEWRDVGKKMLEAEDTVKRHNINNKKGNINYELLWKNFRDCCIDHNYFLTVEEEPK